MPLTTWCYKEVNDRVGFGEIVGYNYYPKTRIFIRQLIKLCLFCPITVTRSTSNVPLSHIGFAPYRPVSSPKNSVTTLSINHTQN